MLIKFVVSLEMDEGQQMGNIWQNFIKCILYIFIAKSHSKFPSHQLKQDSVIGDGKVFPTTLHQSPKNWLIYTGDNVY